MATRHGYPAQLQQLLGSGYDVRNYGVTSRTLLNKGDHPFMKEQAWRDALAFRPDIVVIKLGTNDSKPENWQYGADFENDLLTMVNALKESCKSSKPQIYLCTPIPAFKSTWNISDSVISQSIIPVIRRVAKKQKLQLIDLHSSFTQEELMLPDGIHPNDKGARRLAELVAEAIKAAQ
jgi:lysophospholipase L1-like esterase